MNIPIFPLKQIYTTFCTLLMERTLRTIPTAERLKRNMITNIFNKFGTSSTLSSASSKDNTPRLISEGDGFAPNLELKKELSRCYILLVIYRITGEAWISNLKTCLPVPLNDVFVVVMFHTKSIFICNSSKLLLLRCTNSFYVAFQIAR